MTDHSGRYRALAFLAAALLPAGALAQPLPPPYPPPGASTAQATGAPRSLQEAPAQPSATSRSGPERAGPATPETRGHSGGSAITVTSLGAVEGPPAGTLDAGRGGLGPDLWSDSPRRTVVSLTARLPLATTVASVRTLARRIVLTKAAAPIGEAEQSFATTRIRQLLDAGMVGDAALLAEMAQVPDDRAFARVQAEAMLLAGHSAHLCDDTTATRLDSSEPFWIELRAYCYAMAGDDAALTLTRAIMDAQSLDDEAFDTLLDDLVNKTAKDPGGIDAPTALHAFLLQQVGIPIDFDVGVQLGTPGLLLVIRDKNNAPEDRMRAAERVYPTGALSTPELAELADAQSFTPDQFATPYAQLGRLPFLMGQAFMRQAVLRAAPDVQPALIFDALKRADAKNYLGIAATLEQDALRKVTPQPDLREMAALFSRALMLTGHADAAAQWLSLFSPQLGADRIQRAGLAVVLNLVASDPGRQADAQAGLMELAKALATRAPDEAYAALALGLYTALRQPLPAEVAATDKSMQGMSWPGRRPGESEMARLQNAADAPGRRGEALMRALNVIGQQGPGNLAPDVTVRLVQTLMKLGVAGAAREIAIDALLRYHPTAAQGPDSAPKPAAGAP